MFPVFAVAIFGTIVLLCVSEYIPEVYWSAPFFSGGGYSSEANHVCNCNCANCGTANIFFNYILWRHVWWEVRTWPNASRESTAVFSHKKIKSCLQKNCTNLFVPLRTWSLVCTTPTLSHQPLSCAQFWFHYRKDDAWNKQYSRGGLIQIMWQWMIGNLMRFLLFAI